MSHARRTVLAALSGLALTACAALDPVRDLPVPELASASVATDLDSYTLHRVGLLPFAGVEPTEGRDLRDTFFSELSAAADYELVPLSHGDIAEITQSDPFRRGFYHPQTVIDLSKRYRLDGFLVGTVVDRQLHPPQRLTVQMDLVAAETGLAVWSTTVGLDAQDAAVTSALEGFYGNGLPLSDDSWRLALLSPARFARFAAWQAAQKL